MPEFCICSCKLTFLQFTHQSLQLAMVSTADAAPNWLDRLRSSKGFPTGDNLDLDHFLRNNHDDTPKPNAFESTQADCKQVIENGDEKEEEWLGIMTNVLSDLFNMGEPNPRVKKSCRKQANPKPCLVSTEDQSSGCARKDEDAPLENETKNVEIEEDGERELVGYSRNEVTVIDTSCAEWKFEKLVYRKRNVWKVREKKGKSRIIGRKKRKANGYDGIVHAKKKLKLSNGAPSKHEENLHDDKGEEVTKEASRSDGLSQVPKDRLQVSRVPKKTKKGGSSGMLIKDTPARSKMGAKSLKSRTAEIGVEKHQSICNKALSTTFPGFRD